MKACIDSNKRYILVFRGVSTRESEYMWQRLKEGLKRSNKIIILSSPNRHMELESVVEVYDSREPASTSVCETESARTDFIGPPPFTRNTRLGPGNYAIAWMNSDGTAASTNILPTQDASPSDVDRFIDWLNDQCQKTVSKQ